MQLNIYGFHKTRHDEDSCEFKQPNFRRGMPHLVGLIRRKGQGNNASGAGGRHLEGSTNNINVIFFIFLLIFLRGLDYCYMGDGRTGGSGPLPGDAGVGENRTRSFQEIVAPSRSFDLQLVVTAVVFDQGATVCGSIPKQRQEVLRDRVEAKQTTSQLESIANAVGKQRRSLKALQTLFETTQPS